MAIKISKIQPYIKDNVIENLSVQEVIDLIAKIGVTELEENEKVDYDLLLNKAKTFLSAIYTLETQKELFRESTLKYLALRKDPDATKESIVKEKQFEQGILQQEYQLAFQFENFLDKWRGKKERVGIYVSIDSTTGTPSSYEIPLTELVDYADKNGSFGILSKDRLTKNNRISLEESGLFSKARVEQAKKAYEGVYNRVEKYFKIAGITNRTESPGILLWKEQSSWQVAKVLNYGDLGEAYISFLFDKRSNALTGIPSGNAPYRSHELIKNFYYNYISKVTNMSAIVEEDVVLKNKELAVKASGSGLPGFKQYIDAALMIVSNSTVPKAFRYTKKEFEEDLRRKFPQDAARNIKTEINKEIKDALIEEFS